MWGLDRAVRTWLWTQVLTGMAEYGAVDGLGMGTRIVLPPAGQPAVDLLIASNHFHYFQGVKSMKLSIVTIVVATAVSSLPAMKIYGDEPAKAAEAQQPQQRTFTSPDEAIQVLREATANQDTTMLDKIFGPDVTLLRTGDKVQDADNRAKFAKALAEHCEATPEGDNKVVLEVGSMDWPFPIPLVKTNSQWYFDTAAGREEIINRHIGGDELHAIGVCSAYVEAQRKYAAMNGGGNGETEYATKFKSTPGKKDGLYWKEENGEQPSPFNAVVAEAHAEGYHHKAGPGSRPYHGYYFRILTRQGKDAPGGKMNYVTDGRLTKGFALVAYPELWGQSGIMTFIVNQDGKIYQRNLGPNTAAIAWSLKSYNPDSNWTLVQDEGVSINAD